MRKVLYCDQENCDYKSNNSGNLKLHKARKHQIINNWYKCDQKECTYKSISNSDLRKHKQNIHDIDVVWYNCDQEKCDYKSKSKIRLKQHKQNIHDIDVVWYNCDQENCEYKCKLNSSLIKHKQNIHDIDVVWYNCDQELCDFKCKEITSLKRHKQYIHDIDVVWYNCDQENCDYKSKSSTDLRKHKIHKHDINISWHKCTHCEHKCKSKGDLKKHLESVHDIGNHKCDFCLGNRFSSIAYKDQNGKHKICRNCYNKATGKDSRAETQMSQFLDEKYGTEHLLKTDRTIQGEVCSRYRPDKLYASPGFVLQIECDEYQHLRQNGNYMCDEKRISDIYDEFPGNKYIVIRWNPDKYNHKTKLNRKQRLNLLLKTIKFTTENLSKLPQIFIIYMFYDSDNPRISKNIPNKFIYSENDLKVL